ncbi:MAG: hypothetical protein RL095_911 [Verrucomicrobiota bacterium]|jgi:RND family efflux transporter MFP subunit
MIRLTAILILASSSSLLSAEEVEAISRPSADAQLAFVRPGLVAELKVKAGQHLRKGEVAAILEAQLEELRCRQLEKELATDSRRGMEEILLAQKRRDYESMKAAVEKSAATAKEVEYAALEIEKSQQNLRQLDFEKQQLQAKIEEAKLLLAQTRLVSPLDGLVEEVAVEVGEAAEPLKGVIRVVQINPLWLEVPVPQASALKLKLGDFLDVKSVVPGQALKGKIIFKAALADAASETATIRLEVDNAALLPAGSRYRVQIPEAPAAPLGARQPPGALPFADGERVLSDDGQSHEHSVKGLARSQVSQ